VARYLRPDMMRSAVPEMNCRHPGVIESAGNQLVNAIPAGARQSSYLPKTFWIASSAAPPRNDTAKASTFNCTPRYPPNIPKSGAMG